MLVRGWVATDLVESETTPAEPGELPFDQIQDQICVELLYRIDEPMPQILIRESCGYREPGPQTNV